MQTKGNIADQRKQRTFRSVKWPRLSRTKPCRTFLLPARYSLMLSVNPSGRYRLERWTLAVPSDTARKANKTHEGVVTGDLD